MIRLRKNPAMPYVYDVEMQGLDQLKRFDSVECHIVLYPYSRKICSDDIAFYPFEEYVKDVLSHQRSAYVRISSRFNEIFGLSLGAMIAIAFAICKPEDLLSVESVVSVFGAYTIGKDLWNDIERILVDASKNWRVRFQDNYYRYQLEKHTTLTSYSYLAKRQRYGKVPLLPEKIDFIKQSNSQTLRMCFNMKDLESFVEPVAHVHSIHVDSSLLEDLEERGFLFGVKLSLNRTFLGVTQSFELFQSIDKGSKGCLNEEEAWIEGAVFYRRTLACGRIKWYMRKGLIHGQTIIGEL